jgi:hypothetical protein
MPGTQAARIRDLSLGESGVGPGNPSPAGSLAIEGESTGAQERSRLVWSADVFEATGVP